MCFEEWGPLEIKPIGGLAWARRTQPQRMRATYHRRHGTEQFFGLASVPSATTPGTVNALTSAAVRGAGSTKARGTFRATIEKDEIRYRLSYEGLEADVTQAHIHFGQPHTVGGTITPAQVLTVTGQGIAAGEFAELLKAIEEGVTYVNVHSKAFPGGEIRGQIRGRDDD